MARLMNAGCMKELKALQQAEGNDFVSLKRDDGSVAYGGGRGAGGRGGRGSIA